MHEPDLPPRAAVTAPARRVWTPVILMAIYWAYQLSCRALNLDMFILWISRLAVAAVIYLTFLGWWLLSRRVRRGDRWFALAVALATTVIAVALSFDAASGLVGLPFVLTAWAIWTVAAQRASPRAWRIGFASLICLTWAPFMLIRVTGLTGDQREEIAWRWSPTSEERFFTEHAELSGESPDKTLHPADEPVVASSDDWPEFRGPQRDGVVRGVNIGTDWKNHPPRELWRRRVGPAWSSMCVVGGRVFTQEQRGEREAVACYDADTGEELWAHNDPARFDEAVSGIGPRATPTFAGGRIYTAGATGRLNCLDAADGKVVWSHDLVAEEGASLPAFGFWGFANSPLVVDGLVVVYQGADKHEQLRAFDAATGEPVWQIEAGKNNYSSPQLATLAGRRQIVFVGDRGLTAVEPGSGDVLWQDADRFKAMMAMVQPHVISENEMIVAADGGLARLAVEQRDDAWTIENRWSDPSRALRPAYNDFVVHRGAIYGFDEGIFGCLDLATGKRTWKRGRYGHGQVLLLADQDLLLVTSESGGVILLAADPAACRELGRFQAIEGKTWNHPVVAHGRLYVRNAEEMACFELPPPHTDLGPPGFSTDVDTDYRSRASERKSCQRACISARLSPPNLSMRAAAISKATTFSTITLAAGTAQMSLRSYEAASTSLVARLTDSSGLRSVLIGFLAARITIGWPLVMPASRPPALLVGRV